MAAAPPSSSRPAEDWFFAGLASSFPNITDSSEPYFKLVWPQPCRASPSGTTTKDTTAPKVPACKIFHPKPAKEDSSSPDAGAGANTVEQIDTDAAPGEDAWLMKEQVLVFQYKGTFHAVDHACPHRAYSMSWGVPFDIEDYSGPGPGPGRTTTNTGRTLGHAIRCRGHNFAFELTTGAGDRGGYRLGVWDVELRPVAGVVAAGGGVGGEEEEEEEETEVWVRRQRRSVKQGAG